MIENGTMETRECGCQQWTNKANQYHRLDGPAIDSSQCTKAIVGKTQFFFIDGNRLSEEDHKKKVEEIKQKALREIEDMIIRCYAWIIIHTNHGVATKRNEMSCVHREFVKISGYGLKMSVTKRIQMLEQFAQRKPK